MHARFFGRIGAAWLLSLSLSCGGDDGGGAARAGDASSATDAGRAKGDAGSGAADAGASACSATLTYAKFGQPFVSKYCAPCHAASVAGAARQGAPDTDVFDSLAQVHAHAEDMQMDVVVTKVMPYGTASLKPSDAERVQFGQWLSCGAPE